MNLARVLMIASLFTAFLFSFAFSQTLPLFDNFNYTAGTDLNGQGLWALTQLGDSAVKITSPGLTYTNYPGSGSGNAARLGTAREAIGHPFNEVSSGVIYYSFMVKVDSASQDGSDVACLATQVSSERYAEVFVRDVGSGWRLGLKKRTGGLSPVYASSTLSKTATHVVVVKYQFHGTDLDQNDSLKLWVNPNLSGPEPAPDVLMYEGVTADAPNFQYLEFIEQSLTFGDSTYLFVDGVRISTSWSEAPLPIQLTALTATPNRLDVLLTWSTAAETNNYGFEIERRNVGAADQGSWEKIGFVQGAGTSTEPREYSFVDNGPAAGRYAYRIKQIDLSGAFAYYHATEVEVGLVPKELILGPNYPNPFNPSTKIEFSVPENGRTTLKVFNMLGQEVATLFEGDAEAGRLYQREFNASALPTGVYVSRLEFGGQAMIRKMLFVK